MEIPINAKVNCTDGPGGQSIHVILKPTTEEITHLVVDNGLFPTTEYLVSVDHIVESTPQSIRLNCTREELSKMPIFDRVEFIPSEINGFAAGPYMMWPYYYPEAGFVRFDNEHIPADELAIRRGTRVEATDGAVGRVDEFLMDPANDHITHLVLREGHLWGQKDVAIPVGQIDHYAEDTVHLKLDKRGIEALPSIRVRRGSPGKK
ncbi:MAG TPA: PRC-barrel domain-containing protein [Anaerolineales bacterium]|nr:PRC-barrel domain-containing protein [Anaerolineales bacterium]